ncbi:MAG: transporter substrate-binding domain-containing protein, partial [Desulfuromonadales bacterium]|nr:transporter substrate-binding domain-containing protein [Desulfuromonadales bacterium]
MKQVKLLIACLLALCVVLPGVAAADTLDDILDRGTLRVGMEPGYMPFEMTNKKGEIVGFDVDMAKQMAKAMGVKLELVSTAWDGIIPALITKKFDILMSGMTLTQGRNLKISFAKPYIVIGQSILIDKKLAGEIKSYKDLNNKKYQVASKLGTTGEQATKRMIPKARYISFETEQEGVMDLLNGKVDAFIYDLPFNAIA